MLRTHFISSQLPLLLVGLLFFILPVVSFAQSQQDNDQALIKFRQYFKDRDANALYEMTGEKFHAQISQQMFVDLAKNKLFPLGDIKEATFEKYHAGVSVYKVAFAAITLEMVISLDQAGKFETLIFRPYKEPVANKNYAVQSNNPLKTDLDKIVDTVAHSYINKINTVGLSMGILKDGVYSTYAYGETAKGNSKLPSANTIFELGSITKTFTATLLAWYVINNKVKLIDPITKYLPDSVATNKALQSITLLMLSNHTSGLPRLPDNIDLAGSDSLNPYANYTVDLMFSALKNCKLSAAPGDKYEYSNLGAALLGVILERVTKQSYEQMVKQVICTPLKMSNTAQHLGATQKNNFVSVYNEAGNPTPAWDLNIMAPAGALRSSVNDMLLYAAANMKTGKDKLSEAMLLTHEITFSKTPKVAIGWHLGDLVNNVFYWHNGGTYGSSSYIAFIPAKHIAIIILSNSEESVDPIALSLLKQLQ